MARLESLAAKFRNVAMERTAIRQLLSLFPQSEASIIMEEETLQLLGMDTGQHAYSLCSSSGECPWIGGGALDRLRKNLCLKKGIQLQEEISLPMLLKLPIHLK